MMDGLDFNGSHGSGQKEKYSKLPHLFLGGSYLMLNAKTDVSLPLHNSDNTDVRASRQCYLWQSIGRKLTLQSRGHYKLGVV